MNKRKSVLFNVILVPAIIYVILVALSAVLSHYSDYDFTPPTPTQVLVLLLYIEWFAVIKPALTQLMNAIKDKQHDHSDSN